MANQGPIIHVPRRLAALGGFWVADLRGGAPQHVDAHPEEGSVVSSAYPAVDGTDAYAIDRALDWILNAAGAGRERVARAFRAVYPGARVERVVDPSEWWGRQFGGIMAIEFSTYFGHDAPTAGDRSHAGLVIDDSTATINVTGFTRGISTNGPGAGPGGGYPIDRQRNGGHGRDRDGDAYDAENPSESRGAAVPPEYALAALQSGHFNSVTLGMGGGGASDQNSNDGGNGGDGIVRIAVDTIVESTDRTLRGDARAGGSAGHGSGGGYYPISRRGFTLSAGTTIDLRNGGSTATEGLGRLTSFTVDQPTISGTLLGVATHFQVYPARPRGGLLVM